MNKTKNKDKLRIRSSADLSNQMEGLLVLSKVLNLTLEKWFLSGGTLLGAYRDGDFIPWDWDVEVTVLTEEASKKEGELLNNLIAAGFLIASSDASLENFKIVAIGWGTEYEILGRYLREIDNTRTRIMTKVPARFFETSEMISLRGYNFPAPCPIDKFLTALYGDWKTPLKTKDKESYFSKDAFRKKNSWNNFQFIKKYKNFFYPVEVQEFPIFKSSDINHFETWDRQLGWCNQPNCTKVDKSDFSKSVKDKINHGMTVFNTDHKGSRVCRYPLKMPDVSFYGDGLCMCRNVTDTETFSWYLGESRGTRISNYGVNNYGLDQALLLLQRNYQKDPSKNVVLALSSTTMANCCSVYGHYLDPGNFFAIKPRFQLKKNTEELEIIKNPLINKQDLLKLDKYIKFFRSNDQHFGSWCKFRKKYFIQQLPRNIASRFGINTAPIIDEKFDYKINFWKSEERLFLVMMTLFKKLSDQNGFKPIFLLQHQKKSLEYLLDNKEKQLPWTNTLSKAKKKFPSILFLDEAEIFNNFKNIDELYIHSYHSSKANHMIADYLDIYL